jgi:hypothetical protein
MGKDQLSVQHNDKDVEIQLKINYRCVNKSHAFAPSRTQNPKCAQCKSEGK